MKRNTLQSPRAGVAPQCQAELAGASRVERTPFWATIMGTLCAPGPGAAFRQTTLFPLYPVKFRLYFCRNTFPSFPVKKPIWLRFTFILAWRNEARLCVEEKMLQTTLFILEAFMKYSKQNGS